MRRPEILLIIAAVSGLIIGKLIKNFRWGFLIGVIIAALYAFGKPYKKQRD
ncbi:MAG: hypothetical protein LCH58_06325 [Bacteroidetes bacterium]|jgi:tetrahydromethanopterin S-methyltransferase subunit B|uniref:hypothetical protein n=1 Tax=Phnomibacter sp. TaxID=2836217 RepID=UPI002FDD1CFE|nr:hypothetical protein [Bacteroidota bacterium]MCC6761782.1 hypothetical protein [Chitinophagaceae bacterium]